MQIETKHFGILDVIEEKVIDFQEGLPGFENVKKYVIIENNDKETPFKWLQSVDNPKLAFVIVEPFLLVKDYDFDVKDEHLKGIDVKKLEDILVFSVVVVPEDIRKISINLKAPIIINTSVRKGVQVILDTDKYSVRHYILEELRRQEVTGNASTDEKEGPVDSNK